MVEMAIALGYGDNVTYFTSLGDELVAMFSSAFYNETSNCWDNCCQSAMSMAYLAGAVSPDQIPTLTTTLVNDIVNTNQNHVTVGIIGLKALFPTLTLLQQNDVAVNLAEQTTPPSIGEGIVTS